MTIVQTPNTESHVSASPEVKPEIHPEVSTGIFIGGKPALKNWKMFGEVPQDNENNLSGLLMDSVKPRNFSDRSIRASRRSAPFWLQIGQALAVFVTVAWISYAAIYIMALPNILKTITSSPLTLGGLVASVLAPIAMLWLCIATWQRRSDAHIYAEALREELRGLFYPDADQSNLISDDIRNLMKQATEMSAASRGAIKAIQRARTGLRAEIRDFAGVSQKAEFHIDRLADSLSKRAEELLSLTEVIEKQTDHISAKSEVGIGKWETVSAEISELSEEIDHIFTGGADKLRNASDAATGHIQSLETAMSVAVENLSLRIGSVAGQIESTRSNLDTEAVKLAAISDVLSERTTRLENNFGSAEKISNSVGHIAELITEKLEELESVIEFFDEKTSEADNKLSKRTEDIRLSANRILSQTEELGDIGDLATNKLNDSLSLAISGADTIASAIRRSKDMMDKSVSDATTKMELTVKSVDERISRLAEESRVNRDQLEKLIGDIEDKRDALAQSTRDMDASGAHILSVADKVMANLDTATSRVANGTKEPLGLIQSAIETFESESQVIDDRLATRLAEISRETGVLKSGLEMMATTSAQIAAQSERVSSEVETQKTSLSGFVRDIEAKSKYVAELLEDQNRSLEHSILDSGEKISSLGANFFDKGDALIEKVGFVTNKVTEYEDHLNRVLQSMDIKSAEVSERVEEQVENISRLSNTIVPQAENILTGTRAIFERFEGLQSGVEIMTEKAKECFVDLGEKLDQRLEKLEEETISKSKSFLSTSQDMASTLENIRSAAESAEDRLLTIQSGMKNYMDDLHLVSDQIQVKVGGLQSSLGDYAKDLNDVLQYAVSDLTFATEKFAQTTSILGEKTDNVTTKILEATRLYTEEGHRMSLQGEQATHKSARIVAVIQQESEKLLASSKSSLLELQKAGDSLSIRTKEIEDYLAASINHARTYTDSLREQANMVAGESENIMERITGATLSLTAKAQDIKNAALDTSRNITKITEKMEGETTSLGRVAVMTIEAVDDAVSRFSGHSEVLQSSVSGLVERIQAVKNIHAKGEREQFLSAAKFIIESMYSLSLDVARHLDGDLDAQVLRSYQKGDMTVYVRHLVETSARIPMDKSQRKFIEDSEFRTYVLRFIRQYEELLEQAQINDYSDLLTSVFASSDIGKLYKVLCEIAGRSAREH